MLLYGSDDPSHHQTYTLAIQWVPPSEAGDQSEGTYAMDFGILPTDRTHSQSNPHQDVATSLSKRLHVDASRSMAFAVERLIMVKLLLSELNGNCPPLIRFADSS